MTLSKATSQLARSGRALFPSVRFSRYPLCLYLLLFTPLTYVHANAVTLSSDTQIATAGYFQLSWQYPNAPADVRYRLQEKSDTGTFATIYEGADLTSAISGKPNGVYAYQVLAATDSFEQPSISNIVTIEVEHHSLRNAFIVFGVGLLIFLSILIVILRNVRMTRE